MDPNIPQDCEHQISQLFKTPELRSEIRAYIRHRLFTSIQNSALAPRLSRRDVQPVSPKLQTLNLLIAEYLLRNRHHFSLSVFSCEVPSVSCMSPTLQDTLVGRTCPSVVPFKSDDLHDMLQTLGINPDLPNVKGFIRNYREKEQPLLECLIRALPQLGTVYATSVESRDQACNTESPPTVENNEGADMKLKRAEDLQKERTEWSLRLAELEQHLQSESSRHSEEEQKLRDLVNKLQNQVSVAENTLALIRTEKSSEQQTIEEERRNRQSEIEAIQQKLHVRQLSLSEEAHRLEKEKLGLLKIKKKLKTQQRQLDEAVLALAKSQEVVSEAPDKTVLPALEIELQVKNLEISELKANNSTLKQENTSLKCLNDQQQQRINHLNIRMAELVAELHSAKEHVSDTSVHRLTSSRLRSSSSDSSPTDDIVKDAKRRIKSLEEEFEAIGRYHRIFQARHLNESLISSVHGSLSGQMYVPEVRIPVGLPLHSNITLSTAEQNLNFSNQSVAQHSFRLSQTYPPSISKLPKTYSPRQKNIGPDITEFVTVNTQNCDNINSQIESNIKIAHTDTTSDKNMVINNNSEPIFIGAEDLTNSNGQIDNRELSKIKDISDKVPEQLNVPNVTPQLEVSSNDQRLQTNETFVIGPMGDTAHLLNIPSIQVDVSNPINGIVNEISPDNNVEPKNIQVPSTCNKPVTLLQSFPVGRNDGSPKSTSSSSKHISFGPVSAKDDVDDFWNL